MNLFTNFSLWSFAEMSNVSNTQMDSGYHRRFNSKRTSTSCSGLWYKKFSKIRVNAFATTLEDNISYLKYTIIMCKNGIVSSLDHNYSLYKKRSLDNLKIIK